MNITDELVKIQTLFIDTAPFIYFIEANPRYGMLTREVIDYFQSEKIFAYTSVITLTEVLTKPIERGDQKLTGEFSEFLKHGKNLNLIDISVNIAEKAWRLRGKYSDLRTMDALQISAAIEIGAEAFLTNDKNLRKIEEIKILVRDDFLWLWILYNAKNIRAVIRHS